MIPKHSVNFNSLLGNAGFRKRRYKKESLEERKRGQERQKRKERSHCQTFPFVFDDQI